MTTATRTPARVIVYWDTHDPRHETWAFKAEDQYGVIERAALDAEPNDLAAAIEDAIRATVINARPVDFVRMPHPEDGVAMWFTK